MPTAMASCLSFRLHMHTQHTQRAQQAPRVSCTHRCSSPSLPPAHARASALVCTRCVTAAGAAAGLSASNIRGLIQALPQFRDVLGRLSLHIAISGELKNAMNGRRLTELGEVEQGLVYGEKGSSELIKYLTGA